MTRPKPPYETNTTDAHQSESQKGNYKTFKEKRHCDESVKGDDCIQISAITTGNSFYKKDIRNICKLALTTTKAQATEILLWHKLRSKIKNRQKKKNVSFCRERVQLWHSDRFWRRRCQSRRFGSTKMVNRVEHKLPVAHGKNCTVHFHHRRVDEFRQKVHCRRSAHTAQIQRTFETVSERVNRTSRFDLVSNQYGF